MLGNLNPQKVFHYFEEISAIPHGSGNIEAIGDYCMKFAEAHGLRAVKENCGSVIIYMNGTGGYESCKPVILQGHLDMVCEKRADCNKNMETDPIDLRTDGEWVWAQGTTLGGDDGIAIAYILALLDSPEIPHPPIEALLTSDEETGMTGAEELNGSLLSGRTLINIDSEEEGFLTVSCAGGVRGELALTLNRTPAPEDVSGFKVNVQNLLGGHSGVDINKNRSNAHRILGGVLDMISAEQTVFVSDIKGGEKTNVIPKNASAYIAVERGGEQKAEETVERYRKLFESEYGSHEPNATISITACEPPSDLLTDESSEKLIYTLLHAPDGIQAMIDEKMVKTSLNMGELDFDETGLRLGYLIRSNSEGGKHLTMNKLRSFGRLVGGEVSFDSEYPSWEYRESSPLRDLMTEVFVDVYGYFPTVTAIHAGLECGLLGKKLPGADMVSMGPDLENVHTPDERMNVASVERTWDYLLAVLKALGEKEK